MIIKSITLKDFRQYKGQQDPIEFSTDPDKNVTVILGINTSGKTTLIQAFNWCLYDQTIFNSRELLNIETQQAMGTGSYAEVVVEIELVHGNRLYVIRRSQMTSKPSFDRFKVDSSVLKVQYKEANGEMQEVPAYEAQNTINKILPEELSNYFFFDGEHIADINNKKDVAEAIKGLMGLDVIAEAVKHLNPASSASVISKLRKELDVGQDARSRMLQSSIIESKSKLEVLNEEIERIKDEIAFFEERGKELEERIRANAGTKQKQEEKDRCKRQLASFEAELPDMEKHFIHDFSRNAYRYFAMPLYRKAIRVLDETKSDGEGIPEMHSVAIDYILNRHKCICGCDLSKNQGAVDAILYERSLLPPGNIGTTVRKYKETCESYIDDGDNYSKTIEYDYKSIRETSNNISAARDIYEKLSQELAGNDDIGKIEDENRRNEENLREARRRLEKKIEDRGSLSNSIAEKEREVDRLAATTSKNIKLQKDIAYAIELYNWFSQSYNEKEAEVKIALHKSVNKAFNEMYHGKRIVEIDDRYRIILKTEMSDGTYVTDTSPGLDTVKNFAFISGLVDLAKQKAQDNSDDGDEVEPYPIVMDAPFSNADEVHIENISKVIPNVAEQVILIVMKKDWEYAKTTMESKTAILYEIDKFNETNSSIRRVK